MTQNDPVKVLEDIREVQTIKLDDGDILAVIPNHSIDMDRAAELRDAVVAVVPPSVRVIVLVDCTLAKVELPPLVVEPD
jgi:hypothetical protein